MNANDLTWQNGQVTNIDRCRLLGQKGLVIWFTGLSGAGKSTIAIAVEQKLWERGRAVYLLDGDNLRYGLNADLRFGKADRNENVRRVAEVAKLFCDAGLITLVALISPYQKMREFARERIGADAFIEVYVKADLSICKNRDPKGLYSKALEGKIPRFTGIKDPYEIPEKPDLIFDTFQLTVEEAVSQTVFRIMERINQ